MVAHEHGPTNSELDFSTRLDWRFTRDLRLYASSRSSGFCCCAMEGFRMPRNDRRFHRPRRWTDALGQRWADDGRRGPSLVRARIDYATLVPKFDGHLAGSTTELWH